MIISNDTFAEALAAFPTAARKHLEPIRKQGGVLYSPQVEVVLRVLDVEVRDLMMRLLPLASAYAQVPISNYAVGAVAAGMAPVPCLYLGANLEFKGEALSLTVHAEQAAVLNAWEEEEKGVSILAGSAPPCGYCRQFLCELSTVDSLSVITKGPGGRRSASRLGDLLPGAFGPTDLGKKCGLMHPDNSRHRLQFASNIKDELAHEALRAAEMSYAPYSQSYAGCAIQTTGGQIYHGPYVENAAYNPSLSPIQVALSIMNMRLSQDESKSVDRVVLAEKPNGITQLHITERMTRTLGAKVRLDYYSLK